MFGVDSSEFILVALVALVVIGPKDLPKAMRVVGYWVGRARGVARQFRSGFDAMVREAELEEMEKKWAAENERIMREHPPLPEGVDPEPDFGKMPDEPEPETTPTPVLTKAPEPAPAAPVSVEHPVVAPAADPAPRDPDNANRANS